LVRDLLVLNAKHTDVALQGLRLQPLGLVLVLVSDKTTRLTQPGLVHSDNQQLIMHLGHLVHILLSQLVAR
jgi:hypothetical protein